MNYIGWALIVIAVIGISNTISISILSWRNKKSNERTKLSNIRMYNELKDTKNMLTDISLMLEKPGIEV